MVALLHGLGKYPRVRHALNIGVRWGSRIDLASLSISFGIPSPPVALLVGSPSKMLSTSWSVIGGWSETGMGDWVVGISDVSNSFRTTDVPLKSSSACSSLSVARDLSSRYRGATALVVWVCVYRKALYDKLPCALARKALQ